MKWRQCLRSNWLLLLLLAACIVRLWLMVLPSSFWTDETATMFVVKLPGDASLDVAPQVPASIYYALPRAADRLLGFSEISYRIPSVLVMGIALFFIARLASRLIDPDAGWFAVFVCLALTDFNYYAVDARPYALGICVSAAALYFLVKWLDTEKWTPALLFLLFAALLWRVHLAFWAFYPVFPIYTLVRLFRRSTKVGWMRAIVIYALLGAALMPVAFSALNLVQTANAHAISTVPGPRRLALFLEWEPVVYSLLITGAAALVFKWPRSNQTRFESSVLIGCWWLCVPLCLWTYSILSGTSLFVPRYLSTALPGAALAATVTVALFLPREHWKYAAAFAAVITLVVAGQWSTIWPNHARDIWREGARTEKSLARGPDTPVIAVSPFIEALPPAWQPDYFLPGFLYAPLFTYPLRGTIYPFPIVIPAESQEFSVKLLRETLVPHSRFIVFGGGRIAMHWVTWFAGRPELAGWSYQVHRDDEIETVVFEKPS